METTELFEAARCACPKGSGLKETRFVKRVGNVVVSSPLRDSWEGLFETLAPSSQDSLENRDQPLRPEKRDDPFG